MKSARMLGVLTVAFAMAVASTASAAVTSAGASGFALQEATRIAAPPDKVWAALVKIGAWWNPEHSYSHDSQNMTLAPVAGGCWCEKWSGGSVEHMRVVFAAAPKALRLRGGLGPLQSMGVEGAMSWTLTPAIDGSTEVQLDYIVGGYSPDGFANWSKAVDGVLQEQLNRLQSYVQTGNPNAVATH